MNALFASSSGKRASLVGHRVQHDSTASTNRAGPRCSLQRSRPQASAPGVRLGYVGHPQRTRLWAADEDGPMASIEDAFAKELKRRGMAGGSSSTAGAEGKSTSSQPSQTDPFAPASTTTRARPPASSMSSSGTDGQRARSISLVNEGLEGLIPRASVLVTLGGRLFLAFLPFMLIFSLIFTIIFYGFGDSFIHGGRPSSMPTYIDPQQLLSEPTVDPYIPFR